MESVARIYGDRRKKTEAEFYFQHLPRHSKRLSDQQDPVDPGHGKWMSIDTLLTSNDYPMIL